jgi:hypothetical protein
MFGIGWGGSGPSSVFLLADFAPTRVDCGIVNIARQAVQQVPRAYGIEEIGRIVAVKWVFHRIKVIEVAPELIEAVHGRQEFVAVTEVIFVELTRGVAHRLQGRCNGRRLRRHADCSSGLSDCRQAGPNRQFTGNEVRPPGGAACLSIIVCKAHSLAGHSVQIGRSSGHDSLIVNTDI